MNLVSLLVTMLVFSIITVAIGKTIVFQHEMAANVEYMNDTQTARVSLELRADCKKSNIQTCEVRDQQNNVILGNTIWTVGRADVQVVCDSEGFNVFVRNKLKPTSWKPLIPLKVCGNGGSACTLTENSDTISCTGGSNNY
jgi:hypothetical protein